MTILNLSALQWLRGTIEVHDEMDEMKQEQESMKLVPKVEIFDDALTLWTKLNHSKPVHQLNVLRKLNFR